MLWFHVIFSTSIPHQTFQKLFQKLPFPESLHREVGVHCKRQDSSLKMAKIAVLVTIPFNSQTGVVISHVQLSNKLLAKKKRKSLIGHKLNVQICTDCTYSHEYKYGHPWWSHYQCWGFYIKDQTKLFLAQSELLPCVEHFHFFNHFCL